MAESTSGDTGIVGDTGGIRDAGVAKEKWDLFVKLIQLMFEKGELPTQMLWVTGILILKGSGDYCGIKLIEPFQKFTQILFDDRL